MKAGPETQLKLRSASAYDIGTIAALHADSWRRHYRRAYSDEFLDGPVFADRVRVWTERLEAKEALKSECTIVAERDGELVGFAHTILNDDPAWGALLDNLHVRTTSSATESARDSCLKQPG